MRSEEPISAVEEIAPLIEDIDTVEDDLEEAPILDAIFENAHTYQKGPQEVDAFWDSLADDAPASVSNADVLTYEQAMQLGLAPEDEDAE